MADCPVVLLVDDESSFRKIFVQCLKSEIDQNLIQVKTVSNGQEGLRVINANNKKAKNTLAFIDIILPDISGRKLVEQINLQNNHIQGILISAHKKLVDLEEICQKYDWLTDCLCKPLKRQDIKQLISNFLNTSLQPRFDYNEFDPQTASLLVQETGKIRELIRKTANNIIELGGRLHKVKEVLDHGKFMYWIEVELQLDYGTASNWMRVWDTFKDRREEIAKFGMNVSVLYLMASRNTPESFRDEVFRRSESGNPITYTEAKQLRKEYLERGKIQQEKSKQLDKTPTENILTTIDVQQSPTTEETLGKNRQESLELSPFSKDKSNRESSPGKKRVKTLDDKTSNTKNISRGKNVQESQKQQLIGVIRQQKVWNLGNHVLYCGLPNSEEFCNLVASCSSIALNIGFPNFSNWTQETLFPLQANSTIVHHTLFPELDLTFFLLFAQQSIEYSTEGEDSIIFSFLPNPELLLLAEKLECKSFIAEPSPERCQTTISRWRRYELDGKFPFWDEQQLKRQW